MSCRRTFAAACSRFLATSLVVFAGMVAAAGVSNASGPDDSATGALASNPHQTVLGMSVATALWALFGVVALVAGLIASTRSSERSNRSSEPVAVIGDVGGTSTDLGQAVLAV